MAVYLKTQPDSGGLSSHCSRFIHANPIYATPGALVNKKQDLEDAINNDAGAAGYGTDGPSPGGPLDLCCGPGWM